MKINSALRVLRGGAGPHAQLDGVRWLGAQLRLDGHAYLAGHDMAHGDGLEVAVRHTGTGRRIDLPVRRVHRPDATAASGHHTACVDGSGFLVECEPADWSAGDWRVEVCVRVDGRIRTGPITSYGPRGCAQWPPYRDEDGVRLLPVRVAGGSGGSGPAGFLIRIQRLGALVTAVTDNGRLTGWVAGERTGTGRLTVAGRSLPVTYEPLNPERTRFSVELPLAELAGGQAEIRLEGTRLAVAAGVAGARRPVGDRLVQLTRTRFGNLVILDRPLAPVVIEAGWSTGNLLKLAGELPGAAERPRMLVLRHRRTGERQVVPLRWSGRCFTAEFMPAALPTATPGGPGRLPLGSGVWELLLDAGGNPPAERESARRELPLTADRTLITGLSPARTAGLHVYELQVHKGEVLRLHVRRALPDDQRGPYAQHRLRTQEYPGFLRRRVRDLVLFESFFGTQYSCNPKALHEELRRRDTGHELVWVTADGQFPAPEGARTVLRHSRDYYEALATARILVNNCGLPEPFQKRPDQFYLQTWHATPIKRVGFDLDWSRSLSGPGAPKFADLVPDVERWDLLLSQNPFSSQVLRRAFRYPGEILESGYPRNDVLAAHAGVGALVRKRLGVPEDRRVVLYAPAEPVDPDLARMRAALGDDYVVLLRMPRPGDACPAGPFLPEADPFTIDVTRFPDLAELFLAADVLVAGFSSLLCDFAVLHRPIVLYLGGGDRGVELTRTAPGPVVADETELIDTLREFATRGTLGTEAALARFAETYCPFDDGRAAARVVDRLLM
jgi:CDP-glycerol glycerophosphotransferase